jgi:hypothetical protein
MKFTREQFMKTIEVIETSGTKLNDWEKKFIADIKKCWQLTEKQSEALLRVYSRATGGGDFVRRQRF